MTVLDALNWATDYLRDHEIDHPRLNAELLLASSMNVSREKLYVQLQSQMPEEERRKLEGLIRRRISGEPLQYILGHQEFWSIDLTVNSHVLIPRPETEVLVEAGLLILLKIASNKIPSVLELGTGSGAIIIALAREVGNVSFVATDISTDALRVAKENARSVGVLNKIKFVKGDLFSPFPIKETFDLILSNPPYIRRSEWKGLMKEVRDYEPKIALDGGEDGLDFYRKMISQAPSYLKSKGWLLVEVGSGQADKVSEMIEARGGFHKPKRVKDLSGIERVIKAQKDKV